LFFAAMLMIAAASRDFWISRLERLHALPRGRTWNGFATARKIDLDRLKTVAPRPLSVREQRHGLVAKFRKPIAEFLKQHRVGAEHVRHARIGTPLTIF
jgi:hypothetical protein